MTSPFVHPQTPRVAVACGCALGESALWDHRTQTVLWVDIKGPAVWHHRPGTGETGHITVHEAVGFVALTSDPDTLIAGFKSGIARLHWQNGSVEALPGSSPGDCSHRMNDGHVGPDGTLYYGVMDDEAKAPSGGFRLWRSGAGRAFSERMVVPNGPAVDPQRRILYTVHTREGLIYAHDLNATGEPGPARLVIRFGEGCGQPDGLTVDAEGHLWSCHWGGSRITRFTPEGRIERVLPVPTAQVTKCAFGGPDMSTLYITTAAIGRDPQTDPMAGHLFAVETGIRGLPAHFALP